MTKQIVYIATVGSSDKSSKNIENKFNPKVNSDKNVKKFFNSKLIPNFGPLISGLMKMVPANIAEIHLLSSIVETEKTQLKSFFDRFPHFEKITYNHCIESFKYESLINEILSIYQQERNHAKDYDFWVNFTGGTRLMTIGAFLGGTLIGAKTVYAKENREMPHNPDIVPIFLPRIPIHEFHVIQQEILVTLSNFQKKNEEKTQHEVRRSINETQKRLKKEKRVVKTDIDRQKIAYHVKKLEENGLIRRYHDEIRGKSHILRLTSMGEIIAAFFIRFKS